MTAGFPGGAFFRITIITCPVQLYRHNKCVYLGHGDSCILMFGSYAGSFSYRSEQISLGIDKFLYHRSVTGEEAVEKRLASQADEIIVNPVEPLNLPEPISNHLEISFMPIVLAPGAERELYLKFPVEIGVFLKSGNDYDVLDIFSFTKTKYSLYGTPESGVITRRFGSEVFDSPPKADPFREGVLALSIKNSSPGWAEVTRVLFESSGICLYYGDIVSLVGQMTIFSPRLAETNVVDRPLLPGLHRSLELYTARKLAVVVKHGYFMEHGVS